jgi:glycosyltransferase involved in cell wall biosynthesis
LKNKVIFDATVLVSGNVSGDIHKTGLFRVSYEILKELSKSNEIEIFLFDIFYREREIRKYVQKYFPNCKRLKVYSTWYKSLVFPVGDLADDYRNEEQSSNNKISYGTAKLFKNLLLFIERIARKIERWFFIEKNLKESVNKCNVYFSLYHTIPLSIRTNSNIKKIYTVHDMIPIMNPEYFPSPFNEALLKEVLDNIGYNDHVIAVSEYTKRDVLKYRKDLDEKNIIVSHLAASEIFIKKENISEVALIKTKYNINCDKYLLSVCTIQPRKNLRLLIDAYRSLLYEKPGFGIKLVLTGSYGWNSNDLMKDIKEINKTFNTPIILTGFVSDEDLAYLYSGSYMFIFPSLYEGFGLPVLEAMQCGVPVICANSSSLPEVVGDCGILIDPFKELELKQAIELLLNDERLHYSLSKKSIERSLQFRWGKTTDKILDVIRQ